jgi:hypothetical protein
MTRTLLLLLALLTVPLGSGILRAQTVESATAARLATLLTAAPETPEGQGLIETALSEAHVALRQALLARQAPEDLAAMQLHASGVLHALDPTRMPTGPGGGFGVTRAVMETVGQVQLTAAADLTADVAWTAPRAITHGMQVLQWAEALIDVAQAIRLARTPAEAAARTGDLVRLARQVIAGPPGAAEAPASSGPPVGGLLAVRSSLAVLAMGRTGEVPAALRRVAR